MRLWRTTALLLTIAVGGMAAAQEISNASVSADVSTAQLESRMLAANWLTYNGDYSGRRYSSLSQINTNNIAQLRAEWVFHSANSDRLEVTPVVVNGIMFATAANDTYALDARTGRTIWHHSRPNSEGLIDDASRHISRGVAVWHSRIYRQTDNAHLLCLDERSGHLIWDVAYADWNKNYGATAAPLVVKDKVIMGTSGGDDGVRGFVAAYDALTGKLAWRFWTIPAPGEFGSESWPGDLYLHGGGTAWMSGTYDPGLNLLYWGTSNPAPDFEGGVRPGDDLYTDCVLALDPDTGKLNWYFQSTPQDLFDYDATEPQILVDAPYKGEPRKLLVEANLDTQSFAWRYPQAGHAHSSGGTMTTAGGLLFFGDDADSFEALDAQTGKPLWHFNTGQDFSASPMSYAVEGKQYVAVAAGSDIFSFSLP